MDKEYNVSGWLEFDGRRLSFTNEVHATSISQASQKIRETYVRIGSVTRVEPPINQMTNQHRHHHFDPGEDEKAYHWHLHEDDHGKLVAGLPRGAFHPVHALSIEDGGMVTVHDMEEWEAAGFSHGEIEWRRIDE